MILKEKKITASGNPKIAAGERAEKQMAFYLERSFEQESDFIVINDLRIKHGRNVAQIDHLIITKYAFFIIESKSVYGEIKVNKNKEWARSYQNTPVGMPSPVLQAEAQAKILKSLLTKNKDSLRSKMLLGTLQKGFKYCPINILVAISDKGIINRGAEVTELLKADQITNAIFDKFKELKRQNSLLSINLDPFWEMTNEEIAAITKFLLEQHSPIVKKPSKPEPTKELPQNASHFIPKVGAVCPKCNHHKLIRKSIPRSDGTETDFLACSAYPKQCKAIYALVAISQNQTNQKIEVTKELQINDNGPWCSIGKLVPRKKTSEFLGCSTYPKCSFTSYKHNA
ncbi:MAG: NERD domain-containing protein [Methylophilaceae bacterium]